MGLEDLRKLRCEAEGVPYLPPDQQKLLEAADEAEYQQQMQQQQLLQQQQQRGLGAGMFDTRPQGIDVYFLNRLVSVTLSPQENQKGLWIMECNSLLEQLTFTNLDNVLYNRLVRDFIEIVDVADGEGNEEVLQALIKRWIVKILATKSRGDLSDKGIRERTAWITHKTGAESVVKMPDQPEQRKGFLSILGGKK